MNKDLKTAIAEGLEIKAKRDKEMAERIKRWNAEKIQEKNKQEQVAKKWFKENEADFYNDIKEAISEGGTSVLYLEQELKLPGGFALQDLRDAIGSVSGLFCKYLPSEYCDGPGDDNYNRIEITWLLPK